ncbi:MAG: ferritin [Bacteroidia bacterium]|nr:ferritin [Bacteroidia bacterium]
MITENIQKLLNEQFIRELFSANLYLSICSYFEDQELDGFANFFRLQAQEEMQHAMKQFDYIHQVDGKVNMTAVDAPQTEFSSILEAFELSLAHEQLVTKSIHQIVKTAIEEGDFATHAFLQWFVTEQVEEEALIKNILRKLKMVGDNSSALYLLNDELSRRKPAPAE